tara:strand:+ start:113 stop:730 length:618 start_codon:yes stop_codon:yes gene_type:complete
MKIVSLAVYKNSELKEFFKCQYQNNSNEILLTLIKKISGIFDFAQLSKIFFSRGPGSFTSTRAIKSLSQGICLSIGCKIEATDNFEIILELLKNRSGMFLIFIKVSTYTYSFRLYEISDGKGKPLSLLKFGNIEEFRDFYLSIKSKCDFRIISDCQLDENGFRFLKKEKLDIYEIDARNLALACIHGKANEKLDILYHHTYYEKS